MATRPKVRVTPIQTGLSKAEAALLASNAMEVEDAFTGMYFTDSNPRGTVLEPPFNPQALLGLATTNNTLLQCVGAYEVNIDGTGHFFEDPQGNPLDDAQVAALPAAGLFEEPYPGEPMTVLRGKLRRDQELVGYAFMEVIRNVAGQIMLLRHLPAETVRLTRLGPEVVSQRVMYRGGKPSTITLVERHRTFVQRVGSKTVYFKPFGVLTPLNKVTGTWGDLEDAAQRASEVIMFGAIRDSGTPYFLPRWINQLPSVLGSRKAEELNVEYLNAGGIPPAIILVQGGVVASEVRKSLEDIFSSRQAKTRAAVVEVFSSGGSLDKESTPQVKIERFGTESNKDSLFENYDARCEERVRRAFRLPPLFLGKADAYNFATAQVSYMVAEAQVFAPERSEFDDIINITLMRELAPGYKFRSRGVTLQDAQAKLNALGTAKDLPSISLKSFLSELNEAGGLNLRIGEGEEETIGSVVTAEDMAAALASQNQPPPESGQPPEGQPPDEDDRILKKGDRSYMLSLYVDRMCGVDLPPVALVELDEFISGLDSDSMAEFRKAATTYMLGTIPEDPGTVELFACCDHDHS